MLNPTDLSVDEAQYWAWSRDLAFGYYSKPGLLAWLIAGATSVCGDGEVCVRLPSLLVHKATSLIIYAVAVRLYDPQTAFVSALTYATLPGISFSAQIISTDVPLLFFWAVALLAFVELARSKSVWAAVLLGGAVGLGLNAKYAMAYFALTAIVAFLVVPSARRHLGWKHVVACLVPAFLFIVPNLAWNANHDFATFAHTADNANWRGSLFHPLEAVEFLVSQCGVFGPIMLGSLVAVSWQSFRAQRVLTEGDRMLLAFTLPVLGLVLIQAFLSRAHANWAAPAYVAASIVVPAIMLREQQSGWLKGSFAISIGVMLALGAATIFAGRFALPGGYDPYARMLSSRETAAAARAELHAAAQRGAPFGAVLVQTRGDIAGLLYYGRDFSVPIFVPPRPGRPRNHFELTRPYRKGLPEPVLLISSSPRLPKRLAGSFERIAPLGSRQVAMGRFAHRTLHFFSGNGYMRS